MRLGLALVLHAHQPVGNFDAVIEQAYQSSYLPFLEAAAARPWLKLNLHISGILLGWLAQQHPEYLIRLRALRAAGRLEMLGGGYYEPILAVIPPAHQRAQIERLSAALQR
ncbi:MAG: 4-alpha-glucanotransferase, partial [Terriglobales bacterium]